MAVEIVKCACGEAMHDVACAWSGPISETAVVEWMPENLRANHVSASNRGCYPYNGSVRLIVARSCVASLIDAGEGWAFEVGS